MEHTTIYRRDGYYPDDIIYRLEDGRLVILLGLSRHSDHMGHGEYRVLVSTDEGKTWTESDDPTIPQSWRSMSPDDRQVTLAKTMPDGSYLIASSGGWEAWPVERRREAEAQGLSILERRGEKDSIMVKGHRLFVQRSTDGGKTWTRRDWVVPGFTFLNGFSRPAELGDGTLLVPLYGSDRRGDTRPYVWRSADGGRTWRILSIGVLADGVYASETAFIEVSPGRVLALSRADTPDPADRFLVEMWSDDGGLTWSHPVRTNIWGCPPHLIKLRDGRLLCSYAYRREPMGIRAVLSNDGGETWDTDNTFVLRDDGGYHSRMRDDPSMAGSDVGYPTSVELKDGSILTVYRITPADRVSQVAATRWEA